jgi:hypothetical protein
MPKKILIAGCGQLGTRHLQSLAKTDESFVIDLLDPFVDSLNKAKNTLDQTATHSHLVRMHENIDSLTEKSFDFIIIATNSDVRLGLVEKLLRIGVVSKGWLLEKVLCQSSKDCDQLKNILNSSLAWVNCPRRIYPFYQALKLELNPDFPLEVTFKGANWGLACNSIHYIDLVSYLSNSTPIEVDTSNLLNEIVHSKRAGYVEFMGQLDVKFNNKSTLKLICSDDTETPMLFSLSQPGIEVECIETKNVLRIKKNGTWSEQFIKSPFQSEMTLGLVQNFFSHQQLQLPSLSESVEQHRPLLNGLMEFYNKLSGVSHEILPIT